MGGESESYRGSFLDQGPLQTTYPGPPGGRTDIQFRLLQDGAL